MASGSVEGTLNKEDDNDEDEESGEHSESGEIEGGAPAITKDVKMEDIDTVEAAAT